MAILPIIPWLLLRVFFKVLAESIDFTCLKSKLVSLVFLGLVILAFNSVLVAWLIIMFWMGRLKIKTNPTINKQIPKIKEAFWRHFIIIPPKSIQQIRRWNRQSEQGRHS